MLCSLKTDAFNKFEPNIHFACEAAVLKPVLLVMCD